MTSNLSRSESVGEKLGKRVDSFSLPNPKRKTLDIQGKIWSVRLTKSKVVQFESLVQLVERFEKYAFQEECGEGGVAHYQMCIVTKGRSRRSAMRKMFKDAFPELEFPSIDYLEKATSIEGCQEYSTKLETRVSGPWIKGFEEDYEKITYEYLRPWQKEIVDNIKRDGRTINWYWEPVGSVGKSTIGLHLVDFRKALVINGKGTDIMYGFACLRDSQGAVPIVVLNIPKSDDGTKVAYGTIETLLDGVAFVNKYESRMIRFKPPAVIIFANFAPDLRKYTKRRWNVVRLDV